MLARVRASYTRDFRRLMALKNMPKFVSAHVIACMTRQDVARLLKRFKEEENTDVRNIRVLCDTLSGRMVCEWEAGTALF